MKIWKERVTPYEQAGRRYENGNFPNDDRAGARRTIFIFTTENGGRKSDSDRASLTGLYGPKSFFFKANECMQQHEKLQYALIRMDIYRFKTVNEFCGGSRVINCFST